MRDKEMPENNGKWHTRGSDINETRNKHIRGTHKMKASAGNGTIHENYTRREYKKTFAKREHSTCIGSERGKEHEQVSRNTNDINEGKKEIPRDETKESATTMNNKRSGEL